VRKDILIAAMSLIATQTYAGGPRSLSLAASDPSQQAIEQPATTQAVAPQGTQAPTTAPRANIQTATTQAATAPAATPAQSTTAPAAGITETVKPKRRQPSTEARVIRELHRHGIYW
jgi:hypothetical protein